MLIFGSEPILPGWNVEVSKFAYYSLAVGLSMRLGCRDYSQPSSSLVEQNIQPTHVEKEWKEASLMCIGDSQNEGVLLEVMFDL
jgi:hypothetical protein